MEQLVNLGSHSPTLPTIPLWICANSVWILCRWQWWLGGEPYTLGLFDFPSWTRGLRPAATAILPARPMCSSSASRWCLPHPLRTWRKSGCPRSSLSENSPACRNSNWFKRWCCYNRKISQEQAEALSLEMGERLAKELRAVKVCGMLCTNSKGLKNVLTRLYWQLRAFLNQWRRGRSVPYFNGIFYIYLSSTFSSYLQPKRLDPTPNHFKPSKVKTLSTGCRAGLYIRSGSKAFLDPLDFCSGYEILRVETFNFFPMLFPHQIWNYWYWIR